MKHARTKDEQFIVCLHDEALKQPEIDTPFDLYYIGKKVGLQATAAKTICVLLAQSNFIKRRGGDDISITPHGIKLSERLRESENS